MFARNPQPSHNASPEWSVVSALFSPRVLAAGAGDLAHAAFVSSRGLTGATDIIETLDVPHEFQPFAQLSAIKFTYAGIFADFFYRIHNGTYDPEIGRRLTGQAISIIWVTDYIIDDFSLPQDLRVETLQSFMRTIREGVLFDYPFCNELTALSSIAFDFHQTTQDLPRGEVAISGFDALCHSAIEQLTQAPSILQAEQLGARSFELLARISAACMPNSPDRILRATRPFGSILQLLDDLRDRERDQLHGIRTFATQTENLITLKSEVGRRIQILREEMVEPLSPSEAKRFECLLALAATFCTLKEAAKSARKALGF